MCRYFKKAFNWVCKGSVTVGAWCTLCLSFWILSFQSLQTPKWSNLDVKEVKFSIERQIFTCFIPFAFCSCSSFSSVTLQIVLSVLCAMFLSFLRLLPGKDRTVVTCFWILEWWMALKCNYQLNIAPTLFGNEKKITYSVFKAVIYDTESTYSNPLAAKNTLFFVFLC